MKACILVLTGMFFAPFLPIAIGIAQPDSSPDGTGNIKILTWNIYMLPGVVSCNQMPRAKAIGELLAKSNYDVIVFEEAFHNEARKTIRRLLQPAFSFESGPANQKAIGLKTHSGVWIFSKHSILKSQSIRFKTRKGIDALSRKGALLIELQYGQGTIQVVGTHLQNAGDPELKQRQCTELYHRLLQPNERPGVPQIVCGDFNINRLDSTGAYRKMLASLDARDGTISGLNQYSYDRVKNDLDAESGSGRELIDYILIRPNLSWIDAPQRNILILQKNWHTRHKDLSDHYAIEATVFFAPEQQVTLSLGKD